MHHFRNFKNFAEANLDLERPFTVLIGRNGSGKSNAIEGVELLAQIASGRPLHEFADVGLAGARFEVRGGIAGCVRTGADHFELGFSSASGISAVATAIDYRVRVNAVSAPRIVSESLEARSAKGERLWVFSAEPEGDLLRVHYNNFRRGPNAPSATTSADRSILCRSEATFEKLNTESGNARVAAQVIQFVRSNLNAAFAFDPQPKSMRLPARIGDRVLTKDGSNLSAVLYALHERDEAGQAMVRQISDRIASLPEEPFAGLEFLASNRGDVMLGFRERGTGGRIIDARVLSDGTLRALAVLTAVETAQDFSTVVVEEFDNGLHPSRTAEMLNAVITAADARRVRLLATTHNPAVLDALPRARLSSVVVCHRAAPDGGATLTPLLDLPGSDILLERGRLGDLVTRQIIDQHLAPGFEQSRSEAFTDWLKTL